MVPGPASRGIKAGRRTADLAQLIPDGDVHAIDEEGRPACGLAFELVQVFDPPVEWGQRSFLSHCRKCTAALGQ